ncbi:tyrosine-protein phosphatase Lar-like isoform X5 [Ostrea edulis]|uniref:tyrosine-protein phosphatase Lar-like isoform X5 n=1 Tax=Ostrea edulis TaxID=37623 RepID=UPI0020954239|nr:tyrosine-protein phosphatase Lar-like isoform X5 [Ostrea edulis]
MNSLLNTIAAVVLLSTVAVNAQNVAPQITLEVRNLTVAEELVVSFVCKASGSPQPTFHWQKDSNKLNTRRNRFKVFDMPYGSVLRIEIVRNKDSGSNFTCVAENGVGKPAKSTGHLKVYRIDRDGGNEFPQGYPKIIVNPELKSVEKDKPTIMQCQADANGHKFNIEWFKNGVPVDLGDSKRLTTTRTGSLQIAKALESDYGKYECVASNEYGVAYSYAAMLYVRVRRVPPHFTLPPKRLEVNPNGSVNLTCVAVGSPMPHVMWRDGASELGKPVIGKNVLQLKNVTESKNYTCVASSELGNIEHVGEVIVRAKGVDSAPGTPPRYVTAKALNPTTVSVSWLPPEKPNGIIQGYRVFYTLQADLPIILWNNKEVQSNSNETIITGLKPNDTYTICVLAYSSKGEGPVSQLITVITNEGINFEVPSQPRNIYATVTGPNTIDVSWDPPSQTRNVVSQYWVYYNDTYLKQGNKAVVKGTETKYQLQDLTPDTVYTIKVSALSEKGEGAATRIIQAKTQPFVPSAAPQAVSGMPFKDSRSVKVTWKPPPKDQQNGEIKGYKIFYVKYDPSQTDQDATSVSVDAENQELVLGKLEIFTEYKIWVLAFTSVGDGPNSQPIRVWTNEDVPDEPTKVSAEAINSTAMFVEWRPPEGRGSNGIIRGYYVYYYETNNRDEMVGQEMVYDTHDGNRNEAVITNLKADTQYSVQVAGYTRRGDGKRSKKRMVNTKGAVPTPPRDLNAVLLDEERPQVHVTWKIPKQVYGNLMGYQVIWGRKGESYQMLNLPVMRQSYISDVLDKGATYEFRVKAKNEVGLGERASAVIITPDGTPAGAPQNFSAESLTETSVVLEWDLPAKHLQNGEIVMYQLLYHKLADSINTEDLNITGLLYEVKGLEMNTDYVFQIRAFTSRGAGPWSPRYLHHTYGRMPDKPQNVALRRKSSHKIEVTWDEPKMAVAGYRVFYNDYQTNKMEEWSKIDIGPYTIADIDIPEDKSTYVVRVQAKSVDGRFGNMSESVVEAFLNPYVEIDQVRNFQVTLRTANDVHLSWDPPEKLTTVVYYLLHYMGVQSRRVKGQLVRPKFHRPEPLQIQGKQKSFTVNNLLPKTLYTFNISAIFRDGQTGRPQMVRTYTRLLAPIEVPKPEVKGYRKHSVILKFDRASEENGDLSYYYLVVVPQKVALQKGPQDFKEEEFYADPMPSNFPARNVYIAAKFKADQLPDEFTLGDGVEYGGFTNRPLDVDFTYRVFLRAYTVEKTLYKSSDYSVLLRMHPTNPTVSGGSDIGTHPGSKGDQKSEDDPVKEDVASSKSVMIIMIVAPVCAGVAFIIISCILLVWYMRRKSNRKSKNPDPYPGKVIVDVPSHPCDPVELRRQHYQTPGMISHPPIPIHMLQEHIDNLKSNDNLKFSQEYESIEPGQQFTWDQSNYEINKPKNRYANVIAYDHSRVILQPENGIPGSDYINANYMDGYRKQNAYIATQGPLPETFGDFWRMVWEQRTGTVVMMTRLEERSRIKCDQYWPHRGAETYGIMQVLLVDVTELSTYTIRTFHISRYGYPEKREVRQFQFTAWPDHGVPDHPTPLLMFMRRVKASNPPDAGPLIVHCSAGVGRTGAFIVIDAMLERIKHEKTVDIYGHVTCLRAQRNYMVQTEDQYIFIHDALLEAVTCGNTEVPARNLSVHIQKLMQPEPGETVTGMELEFKRLANMKASPNRFVSANLPVNKFKNRLVNILPFESSRVALQPIRGVDGSDYINASFIDGYKYRQAYVATQGCLAETSEDFWRMLWEHNSTIIVMLTKLREMGREKCHQYWPSERSARYQYFVVDPMAEYNMPQYILREFKVTDARDGQSRTIRQFQFTDWPEQGVPKSGDGFIDFIGQVHKTKEQFGQEGPITVHCSAGVGRTGVFITLSIVLERMRYEGVVDMFQTVKMLRTQRPAMVQTEDQYQFCYRAAFEYLGSFDHYAT